MSKPRGVASGRPDALRDSAEPILRRCERPACSAPSGACQDPSQSMGWHQCPWGPVRGQGQIISRTDEQGIP